MRYTTHAHTINNAKLAGLILIEPDEYGTPEFMGTKEQQDMFTKLENNEELI
jgi:hypothetical protein